MTLRADSNSSTINKIRRISTAHQKPQSQEPESKSRNADHTSNEPNSTEPSEGEHEPGATYKLGRAAELSAKKAMRVLVEIPFKYYVRSCLRASESSSWAYETY